MMELHSSTTIKNQNTNLRRFGGTSLYFGTCLSAPVGLALFLFRR